MPPRILKLLATSIMALLVWAIVPGTFIDKAIFSVTARSFANPPFFITGTGTHDNSYTLRTLRSFAPDLSSDLPTDIAITDDPDNVFQSSPPSPVDFAIILKNLRRLGAESVAIGMPLAWTDPDMISLVALDQQLDALPSAITSAPLSRNPVPTSLPPAFRRASIPITQIKGGLNALPIVNRIPIPDVILGNKSSLAGFTILESEEPTEFPQLIARWEDRVVFSFELLATLSYFGKLPSSLKIHLGEYISLGESGPYIPIDDFGRLAINPPSISAPNLSPIRAEKLIDADNDFLAGKPSQPVLIRNLLSSADEPSRRFSEAIIPTISMLCAPSGTTEARTFQRSPSLPELLFLTSIVSLIYGMGNYPILREKISLVCLGALIIALHFILVPTTTTWPPTLPALAAVLVAIPLTSCRKQLKKESP